VKNPTSSNTSKEALKGVAATAGAGVAGGAPAAIVQAIVSVLGIATEYFGELSTKRSAELFDSKQLVSATLQKIEKSDDFASFVFSIWQKYNLESSQQRRRMLKAILENEVYKSNNKFENFSRIEFLVQNMSIESLKLLKFFNTTAYKETFKTDEGQLTHPNLENIAKLAERSGYNIPYQDLEYRMNDLANNGLAAVTHGIWNGPKYNQSTLGFLLLEYISDTLD
jgi:hypothetical protein